MLGGTIRLDSKKGKGSRFTVEISMQEAEEMSVIAENTSVSVIKVLSAIVAG